jgi:hypothetical protein
MAVVLLRQLLEAELVGACRFPQEIGIEVRGSVSASAITAAGSGAAKRSRILPS